jgi:hypothetical protein
MNPEKVLLTNPLVKGLEVVPYQNNNYNRSNNWFRLEPFATLGIDDDTAYISNIRIRIEKSTTDSFQVSVLKFCNGRNRRYADTLLSLINFNVSQNDSLLMMDRAISINTTDKFRNQYVEVTIAVPVGHQIKISKNFGNRMRVKLNSFRNGNDWYWYNDEDNDFDYKYGVAYIMKENGLFTLDGNPSNNSNRWNSNSNNGDNSNSRNNNDQNRNDGGYRYNGSNRIDSLKNIQERQIQKMQASVDSLKAAREKEVNRLKDSLRKAKEEIDQKIEKLNNGTAMHTELLLPTFDENYSFAMSI